MDYCLGKWHEAFMQTMAFLECSNQDLSPKDPDLLRIKQKIAHWYSMLFNLGALQLYAQPQRL